MKMNAVFTNEEICCLLTLILLGSCRGQFKEDWNAIFHVIVAEGRQDLLELSLGCPIMSREASKLL